MPTRTLLCTLLLAAAAAAQPAPKTRNVIHVMTDGLRWQELFRGLDPALMDKANAGDSDSLKKDFWRASPAERRAALMPFVWGVMAKQGQLYGNRDAGSDASVTNGMNFSYPGYNETLTGFADPRVDSNDKQYNHNVTVYEWLHARPGFRGKVAAFGAWDTFGFIFNAPRAGFLVNSGYDALTVPPVTERMRVVNELQLETRVWDAEPLDAFTHHKALEYMRLHQPRLLYICYGETDEWSHAGKYEEYVRAARRVDAYLKQLWDLAQSLSQYRGTTSLVFTPDHGRGEAPVEWKSHGQKVPDSRYIWMGFLGPDTPPLGERKNTPPVTQSQVAATLAALLGHDYAAAVPQAGKPIPAVLGK